MGADTIKTNENIYDITPEKYEALSSTTYTGNTMKNEENNLMIYNIVRGLGYTGVGDKNSNRKTFFTKTIPELVDDIQNKILMKLQTTLMIYKGKESKLLFHLT